MTYMRFAMNLLATMVLTAMTIVACVGSYRSHTCFMEVRAPEVVPERITDPVIYIELAPEPDYTNARVRDIPTYIPMTEREIDLLVQIAMSEAGNQGLYGKALVMNVVLNRVARNGTDIETEIFKPGQFATQNMCRGDYEAFEAVDLVRGGWDESQGALYFCATGYNACGKEPLFRYKGHWFSK